ncbi:antiviral reverse transcriptase Drt4 [Aquidulcibacter paucihalophilus]|uniref:antiviral reverse transcriptase Drt4 n=1 Tax=Aquidulcibacter paucihalophilus TaxID=1978549 RepID=UPI000A193719|nr:antiviral reverse transcriptase Drt4 [Aquidulcibacter paucihalophilus]
MSEIPPKDELNGLNKATIKEALLRHNFLPRQHDHKEELPPIFNSRQFTPAVADALEKIPLRIKQGYDLLSFKRTRHPNIPRVMGIPHPRAYVELVNVISENWTEISPFCTSPNSQLEFGLYDDGRMLVHAYNQIADDGALEDQDPMTDFGMSYRLKTDINAFYPSVYSHAVPWALVGHGRAKQDRNKKSWFNEIDAAIRICQRNETKGLPIGPGTSSIIAEIVLYPIDKYLRSEGFQFTRYIDDYTVFLLNKGACDKFLINLSTELGRYSLSLNLKKTRISELPVPRREPWVTEISILLNRYAEPLGFEDKPTKLEVRHLRPIIDRALELSIDYPDGSVMKYTLAAIIDLLPEKPMLRIVDSEEQRFIEDALFRYAYFYPSIIPLIQRHLQSFYTTDSRVVDRVEQRISKLLDRSFELGQSDNIVWCLYYLLQLGGAGQQVFADRCCRSDDPIVISMGYCYAKKSELDTSSFSQWAAQIIVDIEKGTLSEYDLDRLWLPLYQLFFDNVLGEMPYPKKDDQAVFDLLKQEGVSFIDFTHDDFHSYPHRRFSHYFSEGLDDLEPPPLPDAGSA